MPWLSLKLAARRDEAETLSDALMALGALSASIEDRDAGTAAEAPQFGEPGLGDPRAWNRYWVVALLDSQTDIPRLIRSLGLSATTAYQVNQVDDQDWVQLTQSQFDPIRISPRLWIVPSWHDLPDPSAINLVLDPGLAFGTGSHPTTRLCLQWLESHLKGGESVLDYGCGSGILAIAARRLGARQVQGVDIDGQAVSASRENARRNHVEAAFCLPDEQPAGQYDVVIANILTNPLKMLAPLLMARVRQGRHIVLSGILDAQVPEILAVYGKGFNVRLWRSDEGWACVEGIRLPVFTQDAAVRTMQTSCPECKTHFRLTQEQLNQRRGLVRCGHCKAVFNAYHSLLPEVAEPGVYDLPGEAVVQAIAQPDVALDLSPQVASPHPASEPLAISSDEAVVPRQQAVNSQESQPVAEGLAVSPSQEGCAVRPPGGESSPVNDLRVGPLAAPRLPALVESSEQILLTELPHPPAGRALRVLRHIVLAMGVVLLLALLVAQLVFVLRVQLASGIPDSRPLLETFCRPLGCDVPLPHRLDRRAIVSSSLEHDAEHRAHIRLTFLLANRTGDDQAWPHVVLTLTDLGDLPVAQRTFAPGEYLDKSVPIPLGIKSRSEKEFRLDLDLGNLDATGYSLDLVYP